MLNKTLALVFIAINLIFSTPATAASDIPLLTWERGKEQNIVMGGYTNQSNWDIQLIAKDKSTLRFSRSTTNKDGYVVYSLYIPKNLPTGAYRVETVGTTGTPTVVAAIQVVALRYFEILRVPTQLITLLTLLIFLISSLSTIRMRRYEQLSYLQSKSEVKLNGALASFYRLRSNAITSLQPSLFKHVIKKEGALLHKVNPGLWALFPIATFIFGAYIAIVAGSEFGIPSIPVLLFLMVAVLGIIDPYSGFTAALGFSILQTMQGQVTSIRAVSALIAIGISWMAPGLFASIYQESLVKDSMPKSLQIALPSLFAGIIGGAIFYTSELLIASLLDRTGPIVNSRIDLPIIISVAIILKQRLEVTRDRSALLGVGNLEVKTIVLSRIVSPTAVASFILFLGSVSYIWTDSMAFAVIAAVLFTVPLLLLQVRFSSPIISKLASINRNIIVESSIVSFVSYLIFTFVQNTPFEVIQKGKLIILGAALPLIIHATFSSLSDTQDRQRQVTK